MAATLETRRFHEWPLEDTATVDLDFARGGGRIFLTWTGNERANRIEIEGERGRIHVEGADVIVKNESGERRWSCPPALSEGSHHPDWFAGVVADFLAAMAKGSKGNLDEALLCAKLIDLAQHSSAAGGARLAL